MSYRLYIVNIADSIDKNDWKIIRLGIAERTRMKNTELLQNVWKFSYFNFESRLFFRHIHRCGTNFISFFNEIFRLLNIQFSSEEILLKNDFCHGPKKGVG